VLDARALDPDIEAIAHLILVVSRQFLSQKRCDVVGLDGVNSGAREVPVNGLKVCLAPKYDIGGVFALIQAPVVSNSDMTKDGAESPGWLVQPAVNPLGSHPSAMRWARAQSSMWANELSSMV
jgi:hypothetical protein